MEQKEIRYERDLVNAYMVLPAKEETSYQSRMVLENHIRGFLPVRKRCHNGESNYYYLISSQISLAEYLEHAPLTEKFLKQLVFTLFQSAVILGDYLLTEKILLLEPETIFVQGNLGDDVHTFNMCLYPDEEQDVKESLRQLMKYLMAKADRSEEACAGMCYELYGLLQKENFCLREFMTVLEKSATPDPVKEPEKKKWTKQFFPSRRNSAIM